MARDCLVQPRALQDMHARRAYLRTHARVARRAPRVQGPTSTTNRSRDRNPNLFLQGPTSGPDRSRGPARGRLTWR